MSRVVNSKQERKPRDIQVIQLERRAEVCNFCTSDGEPTPIEIGKWANGYRGKWSCLECSTDKAKERGSQVVKYQSGTSNDSTAKTDRTVGKKTQRKNDKKQSERAALEAQLAELDRAEEEADKEVSESAFSSEQIEDLQTFSDRLVAKLDKKLECLSNFQDLDGEFPDLASGSNSPLEHIVSAIVSDPASIKAFSLAIWNDPDQTLFKQLDTRNGRLGTHSEPDEELDSDICPATTQKDKPCSRTRATGSRWCPSHKKQHDDGTKPAEKKPAGRLVDQITF